MNGFHCFLREKCTQLHFQPKRLNSLLDRDGLIALFTTGS